MDWKTINLPDEIGMFTLTYKYGNGRGYTLKKECADILGYQVEADMISSNSSGHKFYMEYIETDAEFSPVFYIYEGEYMDYNQMYYEFTEILLEETRKKQIKILLNKKD